MAGILTLHLKTGFRAEEGEAEKTQEGRLFVNIKY